jgi:serine/threonine protein kinase
MIERIGQQFGNYRLIRLLGEGGFAKVYLGEHVHLDTQVAIKVLKARFIKHEENEFLQEARFIASLKHPSIVRVLDCGIERDEPFLIMSYASNGTLRQRYPKGIRIELKQVVSYVEQMAAALQHAHERKLIHRDVKPENMLLDSDDRVLLSDFGIALISSSSSSQSTKAAAGTVSYMAPEQILGKPCPASDQYALGIVVYEWLCGKLPFHGSFAEVSAQHLYAPPPSFSEQGIQLVPGIEAVVMKALDKEPQHRYGSIQDFAAALEKCFQQTAHAATLLVPSNETPVAIDGDSAVMTDGREDESLIETVGAVTLESSPRLKATMKVSVEANSVEDEKNSDPGIPVLISPGSGSRKLPTTMLLAPFHRVSKRILVAITCILILILLIALPLLASFAKPGAKQSLLAAVARAAATSGSSSAQVLSTPTSTLVPTLTPAPIQRPTSASATTQPPTPASLQQPPQPASDPQPQADPQPQPAPDPDPQPVPVQRQLSAQVTQSQTVNATGQGTTPATPARTTLDVRVTCGTAVFHVGDLWNGATNNGNILVVVIDSVPGASIAAPALVEMQAHIQQAGTVGNGAALNTNYGSCANGGASWNAQSEAPFVGGQDAQTYPVVQQSDIDNAAAALKTSTNQAASANIQQQLQSDEHLVGDPSCSYNVSSDHVAGDQAAAVTVTVTATCTATAST